MRGKRAAAGGSLGSLGPVLGAAVLLAGCGAGTGAGGTPSPPGAAVEVYAGRDWYLERPEPERDFRGVLETQPPPGGPSARSLLTHVLTGEDGPLPLYVSGVGERLEPFVGREVVVRGKRVDLSSEGHGVELWAGSIRLASAAPAR